MGRLSGFMRRRYRVSMSSGTISRSETTPIGQRRSAWHTAIFAGGSWVKILRQTFSPGVIGQDSAAARLTHGTRPIGMLQVVLDLRDQFVRTVERDNFTARLEAGFELGNPFGRDQGSACHEVKHRYFDDGVSAGRAGKNNGNPGGIESCAHPFFKESSAAR